MRPTATWKLTCVFGLSIGLLAALPTRSATAQMTCEALCGLADVVTLEQATCVGVSLQAVGYPIYTTPVCAETDNEAECLACYHTISVANEHCAMAYDACIGAALPTSPPAETQVETPPEQPAEPDAAAPPTAQPAQPVVAAPTAVHACADNIDCACPGGHSCNLNCTVGNCDMSCGAGGNCTVNCFGGNCDMSCGAGASCTLSCPGGNCDVTCGNGANCTLNCPGGNCDATCAATASCAINCSTGCECRGPGC